MPIFVHVQARPGVTAAQVEQQWGSTPEPVASGPKGLFVLMVDLFGDSGQPDAALIAQLPAVITALKSTFNAAEVASLSESEFELFSKEELVNASVRKQGLVLTAKAGVVAAASWPATLNAQTIAETVKLASDTLSNAIALSPAARA